MSVNAQVTDDTLLRGDYSESGGTSWEKHEVVVLVTGAADKAAAEKEAEWRAWRDADGYVTSQKHVSTSDPDWAGNILVTYVIETQVEH